jgi:predicted metal-dependent phosphoesterase TrpH
VQQGSIDILEVFNARSLHLADNDRALQYAKKHNLAMSAGSDAHTLREVGRAYMEVPAFSTAEEFLAALREGKVNGVLSSKLIHLGTTWARVAKTLPVIGSRMRG